MPSLLEEIADSLARDVIRASQELKDDDLVTEISKVIGASSPTTQEAFLTAVRVRMAEGRARKALAEKLGKSSWDEVVAAMAPAATSVDASPTSAPTAAVAGQGVGTHAALARPPAIETEARPSPAMQPAAGRPAVVAPSTPAAAPVSVATAAPRPLPAAAPDTPVSPRTQVRRVIPRVPVPPPQSAPTEPATQEASVEVSSAVPAHETVDVQPILSPGPAPLRTVAAHRAEPPAPVQQPAPDVVATPAPDAVTERTGPIVRREPDPFEVAAEPRHAAPGLAEPPVPTFAPAAASAPPVATRQSLKGEPALPPAQSDPLVELAVAVAVAVAVDSDEAGKTAFDGAEAPAAGSSDPAPAPVQHPPGSLAEALARAAAMPKPKINSVEPKKPIVNPYADIEMPDGDWG